jgi:hypothetical protein
MTENERQQALDAAQQRYQLGALALQDEMRAAMAPHLEAIEAAKADYHTKSEVLRLGCEAEKRAVHAQFKQENQSNG